jgi:predicted transcriptional regulator
MRELRLANRPISGTKIAGTIRQHPETVREALRHLIENGDVACVSGLYVLAHGGYGPGPGEAA